MSVPSEERKKYTKSCPGWTITPQWVEDQLKKYRAEKAPVSPPKTEEATSCTPEPQTPNTEASVAPREIPELGFEIHEDGAVTNITNSNQNIWDKLLNELKNLLEWLKSLK